MVKKLLSCLTILALILPIDFATAAEISPGVPCTKSQVGKTKVVGGHTYACWYTKTTRSENNNSQKWNRFPKGFSLPKGSALLGGDIKGESSTIFLQFNEKIGQQSRWREALVSTTNQLKKSGWSCPSLYSVGTMLNIDLPSDDKDFSLADEIADQTDQACPVVYAPSSGPDPSKFLLSMIKSTSSVSVTGYYQKKFPHFSVSLNFKGAPASYFKTECANQSSLINIQAITYEANADLISIDTRKTMQQLLYKDFGFLNSRACLSHFHFEIGVMTSNPWVKTTANEYIYQPKYEVFEEIEISSWQTIINIPAAKLSTWLASRGVDTKKDPILLVFRTVNLASKSESFWISQTCITKYVLTPSNMPWCVPANG